MEKDKTKNEDIINNTPNKKGIKKSDKENLVKQRKKVSKKTSEDIKGDKIKKRVNKPRKKKVDEKTQKESLNAEVKLSEIKTEEVKVEETKIKENEEKNTNVELNNLEENINIKIENNKSSIIDKFNVIKFINNAFDNRLYKRGLVLILLSNMMNAFLVSSFAYNKLNTNSFSFHRLTFSDASNLFFNIIILSCIFLITYLYSMYYLSKKLNHDIRIRRVIASIGSVNIYIIPMILLSIILSFIFKTISIITNLYNFILFNVSLIFISNKVGVSDETRKFNIIIISYFIASIFTILYSLIIFKSFLRVFEISF